MHASRATFLARVVVRGLVAAGTVFELSVGTFIGITVRCICVVFNGQK